MNNQLTDTPAIATSYHIVDSAKARFRKFLPEGHGEQDGEPSPGNEVPIESAGDNIQLFDKDNVTVLDNANISSSSVISIESNFALIYVLLNAGTYCISNDIDSYQWVLSDGSQVPEIGQTVSPRQVTSGTSAVYTLNEEKYLLIRVAKQTISIDDFIQKLKIEKGSQATPYSPYGMGSITEKIVNKNLFDKNNATYTNHLAYSNDFTKFNYTSSNLRVYYIPCKPNTTYSISKTLGNYLRCGSCIEIPASDGTISTTVSSSTNKATVTTGLNDKYIYVSILNSTEINTLTYEDAIQTLQIELGSTATEFIEHEEQTYSVYTQQPFRSIGDVRDCFVKKSDGWYERHYIGELILNGTETGWAKSSSTTEIDRFVYNTNLYLNNSNSKCNYFIKGALGIVLGKWWNNANVQLGFNFTEYGTTTLEQWKTWLSTHNLQLIQPLATPLDLPCTEEQTQQLENRPYTYKTETNVLSEDEVEAYIDAEYVIDLKTYIDNN